MSSNPAIIVVTITLAASAAVWAAAVSRLWNHQPVLPWREDGRQRPHSAAVILAAAWLALGVAGKLGLSLDDVLIRSPPENQSPLSMPEASADTAGNKPLPTIGKLQKDCAFLAALAALVIAILVSTSPRGADGLGLLPRHWPREAAWGGLGFLAAMLPVVAVRFATEPFFSPKTQHAHLQLLRTDSSLAVVAWIALAVVLVAPLFEELLYRVILQGALEHVVPPAAAIGVVAVGFSAVHGFPDALALLPLALLFGWVYHCTRSFTAVVVMHALFNLWNLTLALVSAAA